MYGNLLIDKTLVLVSYRERLSKRLGNRTVLSGTVSKGKNDSKQSLQMISRPLMSPDELKSLPKGTFIVSKTGTHPMKTRLRLFLKWGISFEGTYVVEERAARRVKYADKQKIEEEIVRRYQNCVGEEDFPEKSDEDNTSKTQKITNYDYTQHPKVNLIANRLTTYATEMNSH